MAAYSDKALAQALKRHPDEKPAMPLRLARMRKFRGKTANSTGPKGHAGSTGPHECLQPRAWGQPKPRNTHALKGSKRL
eukprot:12022005-Alexandrium_andersonii.AAC.1